MPHRVSHKAAMLARLFVSLQYLLPHHRITALTHWLTRIEWSPFKDFIIRRFVQAFQVDMSSAVEQNPTAYPSFNQFFTRALTPSARPITDKNGALACPVDGTVSEVGTIEADRLYQAKGHDFSLTALLGNRDQCAAQFSNGLFATLYLAPSDYHRIHIPCDARLRETLYIPGRLFSVNAATVARVPGLFARNERLVAIFDTDHGPMAMVMVGAMNVGSVETVWSGVEMPPSRRWQRYRKFAGQTPPEYVRGDEIARFNMGSTVILLFPENTLQWDTFLSAGASVRMGQSIGKLIT